MPGGDRTGPLGQGSMTGRGAGYCAGYSRPVAARNMGQMGFGRGAGFGFRCGKGLRFGGTMGYPAFSRGRGSWYDSTRSGFFETPPTQQEEMDMLNNQARYLKTTLEKINQRLSELEEVKPRE